MCQFTDAEESATRLPETLRVGKAVPRINYSIPEVVRKEPKVAGIAKVTRISGVNKPRQPSRRRGRSRGGIRSKEDGRPGDVLAEKAARTASKDVRRSVVSSVPE